MSITLIDWTQAPSITEHGSHSHSLDNIVGYAVVATAWDSATWAQDGPARVDVAVIDGAHNYAVALERVHAERAMPTVRAGIPCDAMKRYAVIDTLYVCGCRSDRVTG